MRGTAYMGAGLLGPARIEMEEALKIKPASSTACYNLAQILLSLDPPDAEKASLYYRKSIDNGGAHDLELERQIREMLFAKRLPAKSTRRTERVVPPRVQSMPGTTFNSAR